MQRKLRVKFVPKDFWIGVRVESWHREYKKIYICIIPTIAISFEGLGEFTKTLTEYTDKCTDSVMRRFDRITDLLLGEDRKSKKQGLDNLETMIRDYRQNRR
jgi:hypothetical protein